MLRPAGKEPVQFRQIVYLIPFCSVLLFVSVRYKNVVVPVSKHACKDKQTCFTSNLATLRTRILGRRQQQRQQQQALLYICDGGEVVS